MHCDFGEVRSRTDGSGRQTLMKLSVTGALLRVAI
jgi:hypothetical protein